MKKKALIFLGILVFIFSLGMLFSPFKFNDKIKGKAVEIGIEINAPVDSLFNYLGNSDNAKYWSSYVDHISCINQEEVEDGALGSIRRCYQNADETGQIWDEEIISRIALKERKLRIFHLQNFSTSVANLETRQYYFPLSKNSTKLYFTLYFKDNQYTLWEDIKMSFAAYKIASVFEQNLENIKRICEHGN